jgi:hypothetical protein
MRYAERRGERGKQLKREKKVNMAFTFISIGSLT